MMREPGDYIVGLRHVGIVTRDLDGTVARLREIFGLPEEDIVRLDGGETRFAFFSIGGTPYEAIEPVSERFREILLKTNTGTNHVAYNVSDLEGAVAAMRSKGVRLGHVTPTGIVAAPDFKMAYFDPADTAGVLIEFVEAR